LKEFLIYTGGNALTVFAHDLNYDEDQMIFYRNEEICAVFKKWDFWIEQLIDEELINQIGN